jgi:hypothetical protein
MMSPKVMQTERHQRIEYKRWQAKRLRDSILHFHVRLYASRRFDLSDLKL